MKIKLCYIPLVCLLVFVNINLFAQIKNAEDSFFLLKKKGLWKRFGESIYVSDITDYTPVKAVNPYETFKGKIIKTITIAPTGFYTIVIDTINGSKNNFGEDLQDFFHVNTRKKIK